ncbi:MAG: two-component regulator propeller domain-containing protein [Acidobacteriota bacterium]
MAFTFGVVAFSAPGTADPSIRFTHLTRAQGLSSDSVYAITQDRHGFLWFGTADGLNRYDGYRFVVYRHDPDEPASLVQNFVMDLHEDRSGRLWVATLGGLDHYDPASDSFRHHRLPDGGSIVYEIFEEDDDLWVGAHHGLGRFDPSDGSFEKMDLSSVLGPDESLPQVRAITRDPAGDLWIGTVGFGLLRQSASTGELRRFRHDPADSESLVEDEIWALRADADGRIWVGTHGGLDRYDPERDAFEHFPADPNDPTRLASRYIEALFRDTQGVLWVGTDGGGLHRFDDDRGHFDRFTRRDGDPTSFGGDVARTIFEDRQSNLWVGTYATGLSYHNRDTAIFDLIRQGPPGEGLGHPSVLTFFEDEDDSIWIGTEGGLDRYVPGTGFVEHYRADPDGRGLRESAVLSITRDRHGSLWVGTFFGGLHRLDAETGTFDHFAPSSEEGSLPSPHAWDIFESSAGDLWIGTFDGASRFDPETETFVHYPANPHDPTALPHQSVWQIFEDSRQRLWFVTHGGLALYRPEQDAFLRFRHHPDRNSPRDRGLSVIEDRRGMLWMATEGAGLVRWDPDRATATSFTTKDGLPGDTVYCMVVDDGGVAWATTNNGLVRFDPEVVAFTHYSGSDGLVVQPFNKLSCMQSRDGRIYAGGVRGFNRFRPRDLLDQAAAPNITLTDFRVFNESIYPAAPGSPLDVPITDAERVSVGPDESMISLEFAAFDYRAPPSCRYVYLLDGFNDQWVEAGKDRLATYTNLDSGSYTFRVRGTDSRGTWSADETTLEIVVRPPWWETSAFRVAFVLGVSALLFGAYRWRTRQIRRHNQALHVEITERKRIELERQHLLENMELLVAEKVAQVRVLQGMLPICASCKKIRDDQGYWAEVEVYIHEHSDVTFSHGLCPSCLDQTAGDLEIDPDEARRRSVLGGR